MTTRKPHRSDAAPIKRTDCTADLAAYTISVDDLLKVRFVNIDPKSLNGVTFFSPKLYCIAEMERYTPPNVYPTSLEPENHEKQLFISVWNREVRKLRDFCSTSAPKNNSIPLNFTHHAT